MSAPILPHPSTLKSATKEVQIATLDRLFEKSPALHLLLLPVLRENEFSSYGELIEACGAKLSSLTSVKKPSAADLGLLYEALGAHPRLGAPKVDSDQSSSEQAQLNEGGIAGQLATMNAEYEAMFPGLRFVVFVNGRERSEIIDDMISRMNRGSIEEEEKDIIDAMVAIAKDRASKHEIDSL